MKSRTFNVRLPEDLIAWLDDRARRERRSRNQLIKIILEDARAESLAEQHGKIEAGGEQITKPLSSPRLRRAY